MRRLSTGRGAVSGALVEPEFQGEELEERADAAAGPLARVFLVSVAAEDLGEDVVGGWVGVVPESVEFRAVGDVVMPVEPGAAGGGCGANLLQKSAGATGVVAGGFEEQGRVHGGAGVGVGDA